MKQYTLRKNERLCSKRIIEQLFAKGERFVVYPFSVYWCVCDNDSIPDTQVQVLIGTSKRKFKKAVDRNRVKRLIRECYRLNKYKLYDVLSVKDKKIALSINYIHDKIKDYGSLEEKYVKMLNTLIAEIEQKIN